MDPGAKRRTLIVMCCLIGVSQMGFGAIVPVLPLYATAYGVSAFAVGATIAVFGLARFAFTIPTGQMADRLGRRPTLAIGGLVCAIGNLWCALASTYGEFVLARFVAGGGSAIILTGGAIVLADISRKGTRARTIAMYQATFIFAVGVGPLPGGVLAQWYGLAAPFHAYAVMSIFAGLIAWFAVPETRAWQVGGAKNAQQVPLRKQFKLLADSAGFLMVGLVNLVNSFVRTGAIFNVVPVLAAVKLGLSPAQIGLSLAIGSVLGIIATYPAGIIADRYGRKKVIVPATMIKAGSLALYAMAPDFSTFVASSIIWGISVSLSGGVTTAYAADLAPAGMNAAAMSGYRLLGETGYITGPLIIGLMVDLLSPTTALWFCAVLILIVSITFAIRAPETG